MSGTMLSALMVVLLSLGARAAEPETTTFQIVADASLEPGPGAAWMAYAFARSLRMGQDPESYTWWGVQPGRFADELAGRDSMIEVWSELKTPKKKRKKKKAGLTDPYLDAMIEVRAAGFLAEYVWVFLRKVDWHEPAGLQLEAFTEWKALHLQDHHVQTHGVIHGLKQGPPVLSATEAYTTGSDLLLAAELATTVLNTHPNHTRALWVRAQLAEAWATGTADPDARAHLFTLMVEDLNTILRNDSDSALSHIIRQSYVEKPALLLPQATCPEQADAAFLEAEQFFKKREMSEALASYDRALETCPNNALAWVYSGDALHSVADYQGAILRYQKAIEVDSCHWMAHRFLGDTYLTTSESVLARDALIRAVACNPSYEQAWTSLRKIASRFSHTRPHMVKGKAVLELDDEPSLEAVHWTWTTTLEDRAKKGSPTAELEALAAAVETYRTVRAATPTSASDFWDHLVKADDAGMLHEAMLIHLFDTSAIVDFLEYRETHLDQLIHYLDTQLVGHF